MDIRKLTGIIIRKDGFYLVGRNPFGRLLWSNSPWDAWRTRRRDHALMVADKTGGTRCLFNPVAGQIREMETLHPIAH